MNTFKLPDPNVEITTEIARSIKFNDIFHSADGILEQAKSVFVGGNHLASRWENLEADFTIAELGFGFGVSFLATVNQWIASKPKNQKLNYIGIDAYPIPIDLLTTFYNLDSIKNSLNSDELEFLKTFKRLYPKRIRGIHRLNFNHYNIKLTLIFEDAQYALDSNDFNVDAWYLDGFTPTNNESMWSDRIFKKLNEKSNSHSTFATYSVSRLVKDNALNNGFSIEKLEGFGSKKKMLVGKAVKNKSFLAMRPKSIAIIGGGIAGLSVAHELFHSNYDISIFDEHGSFGQEASGNKAAVIMPLVSSAMDLLSIFYVSGYLHTLRTLNSISDSIPLSSHKNSGAIRLASVKKWENVKTKFNELGLSEIGEILSNIEIEQKFSIKQSSDGINFFEGGSVEPQEIILAIQKIISERTLFRFNSRVTKIEKVCEKFVLTKIDGSTELYDSVVIANAHACANLDFTAWVPIEKIKGQLFTTKNPSKHLNIPLCYNGYAIPIAEANQILIGATYEHNRHEKDFNPEICDDLIERFNTNTSEKITIEGDKDINGRVCFRTTSPDRLPVIGQMCDTLGKKIENLYISVGHGSRGMISCFLSAEIIASLINHHPLPVTDATLKSISPQRFIERSKRRNKTLKEIYPASFDWRKNVG